MWLETLARDVQLALRLLRRTPLLTLTALVSIALSIGATSVVFTAIKSVLLNPLPYAHAEKLVQLRSDDNIAGGSHTDWILWNDGQEIIRRTRTLQSVGIYHNAVFDLSGNAPVPPEALYGIRMTASLFPTLGVSPMLGRNIRPEEDQPGHLDEMIVSYGLWSRRFNHDRRVIGQTVEVNSRPCIIVGVMPPDFNFPLRRGATRTPTTYVQFWASLRTGGPDALTGGMGGVARLQPGVSVFQAQQDLASVNTGLVHDFPSLNRDRTLRLAPLWDRSVGSARNALWFLMAAALMFLLIGCANVANLLLARGVARQREISVRMAIGAGRVRIVRQLLTESCVLSFAGGLVGYVLTVLAWKILPAIAPVTIPRLADARADGKIFAFSLGLSLVNGILFGLAPAFRSARSEKTLALHDFATRGAASGKHDRVRAALVIAEVAITVLLVLIGSRLLGSFLGLIQTDPGFQPDRVMASVVLPQPERYPTPAKRADIYQRFLHAVSAIPGVETAGTVDALPFSGENHGGYVTTGTPRVLVAEIDVIGGGYLQAIGVHLLSGRWFRPEEANGDSKTAIINGTFAQRLWPGESAIGKRICVDCSPESPNNWKRVIGVVTGVQHASLDGPPPQNVYLASGALENAAFLVVRTGRSIGNLDQAIRKAIAAVDPDQPVLLSASLRDLINDSIADSRFITTLLTITGCLGLLMSAAGVYGVTAYTTSRRTQEIGLRMALGATPGSVHALIFRQGFTAVGAGLVIGLGFTVLLTPILRGVLIGLRNGKPAHFVIATGLILFFTGIACWLPARRAMKIDPMNALRQE